MILKNTQYLLVLSLLWITGSAEAQMVRTNDTLYGNEWIQYKQDYLKMKLAEDGIYRISANTLQQVGLPLASIKGSQYQVYYMGVQIPIYVSSGENPMATSDYIEFWGEKNRSRLDSFLYNKPDAELLNPFYSLFNDTSAYFLTVAAVGSLSARYTTIPNAPGVGTKDDYYWKTIINEYHNDHSKKYVYPTTEKIYDSRFDRGEGFFSGFNTNWSSEFLTSDYLANGLGGTLIVRSVSRKDNTNLKIAVNGSTLVQTPTSWYDLRFDTLQVTSSNLSAGKVTASLNGDHGVSFFMLTYPAAFDFKNQNAVAFDIQSNNSAKTFDIENFDGGTNTIIYDVSNNLRIPIGNASGTASIGIPKVSKDYKLWLVNSDKGIKTITTVEKIKFTDYRQLADKNYLIVTHPSLRKAYLGKDQVQEYATYRSSAEGGSWKVAEFDIQEIYNQFGYGVDRTPISMRNFAHYVRKNFQTLPHLFIIGEGRDYFSARTNDDLAAPSNETYYVPTYGSPGSDHLLIGERYTRNVPVMPIGRLAVSSIEDITNYLEKVKALELQQSAPQTIADRAWMKNLIHLGGGGPAEQGIIKYNLLQLQEVIENTKFGAYVNGFYKTSTDPIQVSQSDLILKRINEGVSLITFYGHAAVGTFDFSIDNLTSYKNYGKYPMILSLGCYSGNIHNSIRGIGKRFIFEKNAGALLFGATSGQGYVSALYKLADRFYKELGENQYGNSVGAQLQTSIELIDDSIAFDIFTLTQQFSLLGDPAIRLNPFPGTDLVVDNSSVSLTPKILSTQLDSFKLNFSIQNLGSFMPNKTTIEIIREFPDGTKAAPVKVRLDIPHYAQASTVTLPVGGVKSSGLNKVYIKVDSDNEVAELPNPAAESNNNLAGLSGLGYSFYIVNNTAIPLYPQEFAIVNQAQVTLRASTGNPLASPQKYIMEMDTTEEFNSPIKRSYDVVQSGGILQWQPNLPLTPEKVYYWRVSVDSTIPSIGYTWSNSSFIYLPNSSEGWNQSHYYQWKKDKYDRMTLRDDRRVEFGNEIFTVRIKNKVYKVGDSPNYFYNGQPTSINPWEQLPPSVKEGIVVVVIDTIDSYTTFNSPSGDYGTIGTGGQARYFTFPIDEAGRKSFMKYCQDIIPTRFNVLLFTLLKDSTANLRINEWLNDSITNNGVNIFNLLESYGATEVRNLLTVQTAPYCLAFRKDIGKLNEVLAFDKFQTIEMEQNYPRRLTSGKIVSSIIGPASSWTELKYNINEITQPEDSVAIKVYGIDKSGNRQLLISKAQSNSSLDFDPEMFPYIQLESNFSDVSVHRTSPQLLNWRVNYEPLPDAAVSPNLKYSFYKDTIQQGDELKLEFAIQNINNKPLDSLKVQYTFKDTNNKEVRYSQKTSPLEKDKSVIQSFSLNTKQLDGEQQLVVEVNPDKSPLEAIYTNNIFIQPFFVKSDKLNPILDVTFDGQHILNGDIVSTKPYITGFLKDENQFLRLEDPNTFKVLLKSPGDDDVKQIPFDGSILKFVPATDPNKRATFEYRPELLADGNYQLVVQAQDASGNSSGKLDYKVNFEVVSKKAISNFLNYPNPFTTSTRFAYTLTGDEPPTHVKIQIMTISGQIVREITERDLGILKIGRHLTEYAWDGTDEYGEKLANGIYLYRVLAKNSKGENYESLSNSADKYFENGFGKMVLIR